MILALAILTGAIAVLGEVARLAMHNARVARDLTQAQLLCESTLAQITAGITPAEPVESAALDTVGEFERGEPLWQYSIRREDADEEGMVVIRVIVTQNPRLRKRPQTFSMDRWILEDSIEMSEEMAQQTSW